MQAGGAFSLSSIKMIDPAPLFKAAQTGDVRTLAQLSLKMIEGANSTIGALGQQVGVGQLTAMVCSLRLTARRASAVPNSCHTPQRSSPCALHIIRLLRPDC